MSIIYYPLPPPMCRSKEALSLTLGNLVLVQCQGIVVGFLASLAGIAMGWIPVGRSTRQDKRAFARRKGGTLQGG